MHHRGGTFCGNNNSSSCSSVFFKNMHDSGSSGGAGFVGSAAINHHWKDAPPSSLLLAEIKLTCLLTDNAISLARPRPSTLGRCSARARCSPPESIQQTHDFCAGRVSVTLLSAVPASRSVGEAVKATPFFLVSLHVYLSTKFWNRKTWLHAPCVLPVLSLTWMFRSFDSFLQSQISIPVMSLHWRERVQPRRTQTSAGPGTERLRRHRQLGGSE